MKGNALRIAVLSDIHGVLLPLETILGELQGERIDGYIVAGDLTAGPQPVETLRLLDSLNPWMIRGNSDNYLLRLEDGSAPEGWHSSRQWSLARWSWRHVGRPWLMYLRTLPEQLVIDIRGADPVRVVHGSPRNIGEHLYPAEFGEAPLAAALAGIPERVLVCGHTHVPWLARRDGKLAFNPGGVCSPLNGVVGAQYAILSWERDGWEVEHRLAEYDTRGVRRVFESSGLLAEVGPLARAFLLCIETGRDYALAFLRHADRLAEQAGAGRAAVVPDDIWDAAAASFDWGDQVFDVPGTWGE